MSRFARMFETLRDQGRAALMPFLEAGHPDLDAVERMVPALVDLGCDAIELGVPFSDPIADGPTMQAAALRALQAGVRLADVLELVHKLRRRVGVPIALMSYANPLLRYGFERFCHDAVGAGVDGVIAADIPADEGRPLIAAARQTGLDTTFLVAPTSTDERIRAAAEASTGFLYCVSVTGVTGERETLSGEVAGLVRRVRRITELPAVVGFGISTPEHARRVSGFADGVIVASALYRALEGANDPVAAAVNFLCPFVHALRAAPRPQEREAQPRR